MTALLWLEVQGVDTRDIGKSFRFKYISAIYFTYYLNYLNF